MNLNGGNTGDRQNFLLSVLTGLCGLSVAALPHPSGQRSPAALPFYPCKLRRSLNVIPGGCDFLNYHPSLVFRYV